METASHIPMFGLDHMNESFGWPQALDASPLSEDFSDVDSSSVFSTLAAHDIACKEEPTNMGIGWEMYQNQAYLHRGYGMGVSLPHDGFVQDLHSIQTAVPAQIKDEPLSGISEASSINSPATTATTDSSSAERIHGWDPLSFTQQRKRSLSDCASYLSVNQTRKRSTSDAYPTFQTIPGAAPQYGDFPVSSSFLHGPEPAGYYRQTPLPFPRSHTWPRSHSNSDSPTGLSDQFGTSYDYSPVGLYDGHGQGCLPTEDVMGNGQTSITGSHFKAQVASPAVQKAAWKKRKNRDGKVFECEMCGAHLTTKQNLSYHIAAHLGKRDYACYRCNKLFTTPHVRNRHEIRCRNQEVSNVRPSRLCSGQYAYYI